MLSHRVQAYLVSAIALFALAGVLLDLGLPYTITHPACRYCNSVNPFTVDGELYVFSTYYEPLGAAGTLYGILASVVGIMMFVLHRLSRKDTIANST